MKNIDFIIAVKNRENSRIQRCINSFKSIANKIIVVDYNSKNPVKVNNAEILRIEGDNYKIWNKSHALNLGIKKSHSEYICTIDCDMILTPVILNKIESFVKEDIESVNKSVMFNTNVRRVEIKNISKDLIEMSNNSIPWFKDNNRSNIYSSANGGIQIFPRKWINKIGGYDEGLGIYWGAMDNRIYEQAKGTGMRIVDINLPMFHQEHKNKKEDNLDKDEISFAQKVRIFKVGYLNKLINENNFISKKTWGRKLPNHNWMIKLVKKWEKNIIIEPNISDKKLKVYIAIITNYEYVPTYFALNLTEIISSARSCGIEIIIKNIRGPAVDSIRNMSVIDALNNGATHIIQLDTDHIYPNDLIYKLALHDKDFVCGITNKRTPPYTQTQYKECNIPRVNVDKNICKFNGNEGLVKIKATGMVGSLINLNIFNKLTYPYYDRIYKVVDKKLVETGEDIFFCRKLDKAKIDILCDTSLSYPHQTSNLFVNKGDIVFKC